ncbi:SGNH/GDSL hydrolase family protein [Ramlibacter sp. XY19]|uniref:SGNH/GDSL hydrolase family protein n=1 Tax=Ramlibacter paludis TaxID=2908000 RepID=UPI0023DB186B|nr:SGNH/GDSL hydrolase family protein [Ramlibacter paludis]MCG2594815.1 SGNH/GDSL hydrolase family protein [Ramlibacter paludis]
MASKLLRRALLLAVGASALVLAACGGGTVESQFEPARVVAFGDGMADLGQNGKRYTINDGSTGNWTEVVSLSFLQNLTASSLGGLSYATGNARVVAKPDAAGNGATPTVKEQIDTFLTGHAFTTSDLVLVSAGVSDVIVQGKAVIDGTQTEAAAVAAVEQAGIDLAGQVRRIVNAGASHVVVVGSYNLGRSVWAFETNQANLLQTLSGRFNDKMLVTLVDLGASVLYVDSALYFNLSTSSPASYGITDVTHAICTSVDPGVGIGTGTGQVNSNLCTGDTLLTGSDRTTYLFADRIYPTPRGQQLFGDYAANRVRDRW